VFFSGDQLGAAEWGLIAGAVKGHPNLRDIVDHEWSRSVLEQGVTAIDLCNKKMGVVEAVVLGHLLPRSGSLLTELLLG
jgi:hypothetical protein